MSAIAGVFRLDGAPAGTGLIERMTTAMARRAPHGRAHWHEGPTALGHGALRSLPASVGEVQPCIDAEAGLALVLDGVIDNHEELRAALLARGVRLRGDGGAELALRACEAWGDDAPAKLVGEFVFALWDSRRRRLLVVRDAVGTRLVHYHATGRRFAFASEIRGLLACADFERRLHRPRLLDYLSDEFDREDERATFYEGVYRLPAGHALRVDGSGVRTWRYWQPRDLAPLRFGSLREGAEAYLDLLRVALRCRLDSTGRVAALLSGGHDSSSLVALAGKEFRTALPDRLVTISLAAPGSGRDPEALGRREILADAWFDAVELREPEALQRAPSLDTLVQDADEPFSLSQGFGQTLTSLAARRAGCRVLMDGMASDLYYYAAPRSLATLLREGPAWRIPSIVMGAIRYEGASALPGLAWSTLQWMTPEVMREGYRRARASHAPLSGGLRAIRAAVAREYLEQRREERRRRTEEATGGSSSQQALHAADFASGMLNFAHEVNGSIDLAHGIEPRSPYSDRRLVEFAIAMPLELKLSGPVWKGLLREAMKGILPEPLRTRRATDGYPGIHFFESWFERHVADHPALVSPRRGIEALGDLADPEGVSTICSPAGVDRAHLGTLVLWLERNLM